MATEIRLQLVGQPVFALHAQPWQALSMKDAVLLAMAAMTGKLERSVIAEWMWPPENDRLQCMRVYLTRMRKRLRHPLFCESRKRLTLLPTVACDIADNFKGALKSGTTEELLGSLDCLALPTFGRKWVNNSRQSWRDVKSQRIVNAVKPQTEPEIELSDERFVARDRERSAMRGAWRAHKAFVLFGAPGVGKSRLLREFCAGEQGLWTVSGMPGDALTPYRSASQWAEDCEKRWVLPTEHRKQLLRLSRDVASRPAGGGNPHLLQHALEGLLQHAAKNGISAFIVDNLHLVDDATQRFLWRCMPSIPGLLFGFAARDPDDTAGSAALRAFCDGNDEVIAIELRGLSVKDIETWLDALDLGIGSHTQRAQKLLRMNGGNPWEVRIILRHHLQGGALRGEFREPPDLVSHAERLLLRLSSLAYRLSWLAAIAGPNYDLLMASRVLQASDDALAAALQELQRLHVFHGTYFAHDILRDAAGRGLPPGEADAMRVGIADGLAARNAPPEELVHHYQSSSAWPQAAKAAEAAARQSERIGQLEQQLVWLDRAVGWYRQGNQPMPAQRVATFAIGVCLMHEGPPAASVRAEAALASCRTPAQVAAVNAQRARIAIWMHQAEKAQALALAALNSGLSPFGAGAPAVGALAIAQALQNAMKEALNTIEPVIGRMKRRCDAATRQELWRSYGWVLSLDERWRQVAAISQEALTEAIDNDSFADQAKMLNNLGAAQSSLGDASEGIRCARESLKLHRNSQDREADCVARTNLAAALLCVGEYSEAKDLCDGVIAQAVDDPSRDIYVFTTQDILSEIWLALGRPDLAKAVVASEPPSEQALRRLTRHVLRARAASQAGDADAADHWREVLAQTANGKFTTTRQLRLQLAGIAHLEPTQALAICSRTIRVAQQRDNPVFALLGRLRRAQTLLRQGRAAAALADVRKSLVAAGQVRHVFIHTPEVWWTAAQVLHATKQLDELRACLGEARAWLLHADAHHVPEGCQAGFLEQHPVHSALLADARRWLDT